MLGQREPRYLLIRSFADIITDPLPQHVPFTQRLVQTSSAHQERSDLADSRPAMPASGP